LSHLLFVIVMETLSKMLVATKNEVFLFDFFVGSRNIVALHISHLLFVDDTLIFCEENPYHLRYLCALFLCFEIVSSLSVNLAKSKLVYMGSVNNVDGLADILCSMFLLCL
jgi:hypothetical protein